MPDLPASERLVRDLEAVGDPRLAPIIEKARSGYYDFVDRFILVDDLLTAGHPELAESAWNGLWEFPPKEIEKFLSGVPMKTQNNYSIRTYDLANERALNDWIYKFEDICIQARGFKVLAGALLKRLGGKVEISEIELYDEPLIKIEKHIETLKFTVSLEKTHV